jgi:hypothetical protein
MRDAIGQDPSLPRPGSGDDEQGSFRRENGLPLSVVQVCEVAVGCGDGHAAMLDD